MEIKVKDRQSLADIAVQTAGSMEAAFRLAEANDLGLTDTLTDGQTIATVAAEDAAVVRRYTACGLEPATVPGADELTALAQEGINYMGIEIDFIVS